MDRHGYFDAEQCNIYTGLKRSTQRELHETLRNCRLRDLLKGLSKRELREFVPTAGGLATGSLGASGAQYLVPTWMSQKLYLASNITDITPLISADVFEPRGGDCTVPVGIMKGQPTGEGTVPHETVAADVATIKLEKFAVPIVATNEMIEDNEYGIIEWNIQKAGEAIGRTAGDSALTILHTATDGYGTVATAAGAADETLPAHIWDCMDAMAVSDPLIYPIPDTMVITPEAWSHSIASDLTAAYMPTGANGGPPAPGFNFKWYMLDVRFSGSPSLATGGAGAVMTKCKTVLLDRKQAMVTARKNWLRVENYANPVMDLAGAVVTGRQDSVTVVNCAIGVVTEA